MTGTIKKIVGDRGFGFIKSDGGNDIFFHMSNLHGVSLDRLDVGDQVSFEIEDSPKGPRAMKVTPIETA